MKRKRLMISLFLTVQIWCVFSFMLTALANNETTNKELLQKGLTLYEIDQELTRLTSHEANLQNQLNDTEQQIQAVERTSAEAKVHAAKVIRSYYMGDRGSLWTSIFSIRSLSDAITTMEYLQMILLNDQQALKKYTSARQQLKELQRSLNAAQASLQQTKSSWLTQRALLVAMQKEIDEQLAQNLDARQVQNQMAEFNQLWKEKGLPLFRTYLQALTEATNQLSELVTSGSGNNSHLIMDGFRYIFQLTDQDLNAFLRKKNRLFDNMNFRFTTDQVIASGKKDGMDLTIKGSYQLAMKDNDPNKPYVQFHIQELQFNGFTLPSTTAEALEKDFDLGIYPQKIASLLQVTDVKLEEGLLKIMLKLAL